MCSLSLQHLIFTFVMSGVAVHRAELTHFPLITFQIQIKYGFKLHFSQLLVFRNWNAPFRHIHLDLSRAVENRSADCES